MDVVTKATATVTPVEDSKSKHGEFDVILSTNALDRDGDELHADEWKQPLPDKITFDSDHGMSVATCVGSGRPFINDAGQLQVRGTYASTPHGQSVRTLVNEGHITSVSVAFMEHKNAKGRNGGPVTRELLNGAFVAVPANPEAVVLSSKSADDGDKKKPYGDVTYADPKNNKYPIDTEAHVRAAWSYINMPKNQSQYSSEELSAIKGRIKRAAEKFGIDISDDSKKSASDFRSDEMAAIGEMFDPAPQTKAYWQGVHDLAVKLGAGCPDSDPDATEGVLNANNRAASQREVITKAIETAEEFLGTESSPIEPDDGASAGAPQDAAPAGTDDETADVALLGKSLALKLGLITST